MLPRIRIIQIGDVHLERTAQIGRPIDQKDRRFPVALRNLMAGPPIKAVFRKVHKLLEVGNVDCLLFMGDLAEQGRLEGFNSCVRYIAESLQIGTGRRFEAVPVGIVPGNHDINRDLAAKPGMRNKFQPLQEAMNLNKLPAIPIDAPVWKKIVRDNCRIDVAMLNSCWGCGAKESIPEEFRAEIFKAIETSINGGADKRAVEAYYDRQFDTPAFSDNTIQRVVNEAASIPKQSLILTTAHHNILPQRLARLAPYTELVNGGVLRNAFLQLGRPVLYLHGHIHEDPVEIIHKPNGNPLVCISAPEAADGFNVLEIVFTPDGLPLSVYLQPWRFDEAGVFRNQPQQTIPIKVSKQRPPDPVQGALFNKVVSEKSCYWHDLTVCAVNAGAVDGASATEEALELLAADGLVRIENYDLGYEHWMVGSRV